MYGTYRCDKKSCFGETGPNGMRKKNCFVY